MIDAEIKTHTKPSFLPTEQKAREKSYQVKLRIKNNLDRHINLVAHLVRLEIT